MSLNTGMLWLTPGRGRGGVAREGGGVAMREKYAMKKLGKAMKYQEGAQLPHSHMHTSYL